MDISEALYFCPQLASQKKIYVSTLLRLQDILTPGGAERRQEPDGVAILLARVLLNFAFGGGWRAETEPRTSFLYEALTANSK